MKNIRHYVAAGFVLFALARAADAQPPTGFERWTEPAESGIVFGAIFADLFKEYSNPASTIHGTLFAPVPSPPRWKVPRRLIDIEIRQVNGLNVVDAVWVNNTENFKLDSWLINGMTQAQLAEWTRYSGYVMLDIERYKRGSQDVFAGILQRNPHHLEWRVLFAMTLDEITLMAGVLGMRIIDIDMIGVDGYQVGECPSGQYCFPKFLYDAVLMKNEGSNFIGWSVAAGLNTDEAALVPFGYQLIDREKWKNVESVYLSVMVGNGWETHNQLSQAAVLGLHNHSFKRVIDLEIDHTVRQQPEFPIFHTVNIVP